MDPLPFDFANLPASDRGAPSFPLGYGLDRQGGNARCLPTFTVSPPTP
jgi:hypothetical protein